ncbi:MAG: hypothetical protein KKD39_08585, partial [Candidatus Altiarchaeota archaeon]|nr:hypothetical protein [Candidatus Altiarchaeota archaeon]
FLYLRNNATPSVALLSMLFFAAVKSNRNLLGTWFFTPHIMSFFTIFFLFYLYSIRSKLVIFALLVSSYIYPLSGFLFLTAVLAEHAIKLNKRLKCILVLVVVGATVSVFYHPTLKPLAAKILGIILFDKSKPFPLAPKLNLELIKYVGLTQAFLALIGLFVVRKQAKVGVMMFSAAFCFLNIVIGTFLSFTILLPYLRAFYYLMILIAPLSALGLDNFIRKTNSILRVGRYSGLLAVLIASCIFYVSFLNYYDIDRHHYFSIGQSRYYVILYLVDEDGYDAINYIGEHYPSGVRVLADPLISYGIYPISKNYVINLRNANLGVGNQDTYSKFMSKRCEADDYLRNYTVDYIITTRKLSCSWLNMVYENNKLRVYEVYLKK